MPFAATNQQARDICHIWLEMASISTHIAADPAVGSASHPPFPADLPIARISNISHQRILDGDMDEIAKVVKSAREVGFFRVDLRDSEVGRRFLAAANKMFVLAEETFDLPTETKLNDSFLKHGDTLLG